MAVVVNPGLDQSGLIHDYLQPYFNKIISILNQVLVRSFVKADPDLLAVLMQGVSLDQTSGPHKEEVMAPLNSYKTAEEMEKTVRAVNHSSLALVHAACWMRARRMDANTSASGRAPSQNTSPIMDPVELRDIIVRQGAIIRSYQDQMEAQLAAPTPGRDFTCCHSPPWTRPDYPSFREEAPEPMQLGRSKLAEPAHQQRGRMRLCYNCGASGHQSSRCPEKSAPAQVGGSSLFFSLLVPVSLSVSDRCISVPALIDSGEAVNLIDGALMEKLGIPTFPCMPSLRITAIDSQPIGEGYLKRQTELLEFRVGLFYQERLAFYVTSSPANPMILGFLWLRRHDPQISWRSGELVRWSPACLDGCLRNQVSRPCRTSRVREMSPPTPGHLLQAYAEFWEVFRKERVARLPAHQPWDCAIDLLPNNSPPRGRVYPLSLPESKAMEEYIETALAAEHIRPSTAPAAAGFFFVGKKDGGLRPCIDYQGLNAITVPYPYPLPLVPAALEQLRGARMFTKLDLRSAYNLVQIRKGDEWKTVFHTTHGHYEYRVSLPSPD
ncbi:hypothetical protein QTP86_012545 [Hemibagrus guttatus]|nr:hypothetical protein QTP86_012545 [Hemibagrus guttatus]